MVIKDLLKSMDIELSIDNSNYLFNGYPVPRVTNILSAMLHEDYLMTWANAIGLYQHTKYADSIGLSAKVGTHTHDSIEAYIRNGEYSLNRLNLDYGTSKKVHNGVESFILWWDEIHKYNTVEVLGIEESLACKWFGGTYDFLLKIGNKKYLVDFKTSNHIGVRYFYQLAAYRYMIKESKGIDIDGCLILQVDKKKPMYTEYALMFDNEKHKKFFESCETAFFSLVYAYWNRRYTEEEFKKLEKELRN